MGNALDREERIEDFEALEKNFVAFLDENVQEIRQTWFQSLEKFAILSGYAAIRVFSGF